MPFRKNEIHRNEIIELAGDIVIDCSFERCEFVGYAVLFHNCHLDECVNSPDVRSLSSCIIIATPISMIIGPGTEELAFQKMSKWLNGIFKD